MELIEIARLEELRRATSASETALEARWLEGGGVACKSTRGTWGNYVVGMGLSGKQVARRELEEIVAWYEASGIEARLEVAPFVDRATLRDCDELGFGLRECGNVFYREVSRGQVVRPVVDLDGSIVVREVDRADAGQVREFVEVVARGFSPPGKEPTDAELELSSRFVRRARTVAMTAYVDGKAVGGGAMDVDGEVAALMALAVLEPYRRRGVQQMLIAARLNRAAEMGVTLTTIGSRPGAGTERNVRRMGFLVAYTKFILVKSGPGLVGFAG